MAVFMYAGLFIHVIDNQKKYAMNSLGRIDFKRDDVFSQQKESNNHEDQEENPIA